MVFLEFWKEYHPLFLGFARGSGYYDTTIVERRRLHDRRYVLRADLFVAEFLREDIDGFAISIRVYIP